MSPRRFRDWRGRSLARWATPVTVAALLAVAVLAFSAWADGTTLSEPRGSNSDGVRAPLIQLGFLTADEPPATAPLPPAPEAPALRSVVAPSPDLRANSQISVPPHVPPTPDGLVDEDEAKSQPLNDPWWMPFVNAPLRPDTQSVSLTLDDLLVRAIRYSSQVKVFSDLPLIRETTITEADAAFDWVAFLDNRWADLNDPVGNLLTLGPGAKGNRYVNQQYVGQGGLRKKTRDGGTLQLSQQFGWQETNSLFFVPSPQGTTRLVVGYTHPLWRGGGQVYNESLIVLAQIDSAIACDEFSRQLQAHLLDVLRGYWSLYLERANLAQKLQSLKRASDTLAQLRQRQHLDVVRSQIMRAKAETATRRSQVLRAEMGVKNAEDRIRALVNDPALGNYDAVELLPVDPPTIKQIPLTISLALTTAVQLRPEVNQALRQIQAGCTRLEMSKNEVLPMLNLVTEAYVAGLQQTNPILSYENQFMQGRPGYTVGLQFEMPLGNRGPQARRDRRELELRQLRNQYQTTLNTLQLEVKVSVREVETALADMLSQHRAMSASTVELDYLEKRWEHLPGEDKTASLQLENLLDAQARLAQNEFAFLAAQVSYNLALWNVKKSTGELLQTENVTFDRTCVEGLPTMVVDKSGQPVESIRDGMTQPLPPHSTPIDHPRLPQPIPEDNVPGTGPALRPMSHSEPNGQRVEPRPSWWRSKTDKLWRRD